MQVGLRADIMVNGVLGIRQLRNSGSIQTEHKARRSHNLDGLDI